MALYAKNVDEDNGKVRSAVSTETSTGRLGHRQEVLAAVAGVACRLPKAVHAARRGSFDVAGNH